MRSEQDEVEAGLGTRSHVWIAALSDKLPPCPSRAGASPAALVPAKCMYKRQTERVCPAERRHSLVIVWNGWFRPVPIMTFSNTFLKLKLKL
jgi:hypothetical protein